MARIKRRLVAEDRRALIEEAAARLFAERGYAATRLSDIAAAANVTKPVLYRHYASKLDLHLALLIKHRDELFARVLEQLDPSDPLQPQIALLLDAWFAYVEDHPFAWKMLFTDTTGDPQIQAFHRELHDSGRGLLISLIRPEELELPTEEIEPLAEIVRSATTGLALWWLEHPDVPRQVLVDAIERTIAGLLRST